MASERYTEKLILKEMKAQIGENDFGHVFPQGDVSTLHKLDDLLKKAGGKPKECTITDYPSNSKGKARPEFIITFKNDSSTIMVVECKGKVAYHETKDKNRPRSYAVDGVLYYAKFLKQEYNVIAIAISGSKRENASKKEHIKVSAFHWLKGHDSYSVLERARDIILEPQSYIDLIKGKKLKKSYSLNEIRNTAIDMHNYLREIKMSERHKPIFIAGILIALEDEDFIKSYNTLPSYDSIIRNIQYSIENVLKNSNLKSDRISYIQQSFELLHSNTKFKAIPLGHFKSISWYIEQLELKIKPMMDYADSTVDALGVFYHEFIKYSGGDGKGLGIILTPQHITEFMCEVAAVNKNSRVVDICCGSASFLITSMAKMFQNANPNEIDRIKNDQLFGVEINDELYSLAVANMIIRKDGKSNIYYGDCFNGDIALELKEKYLNIGLINPPYSQTDKVELEFLEQLLDILVVGGIGVCIVPFSCAIGTKFKEVRERLLKNHTLSAVFSMPKDTFYPRGNDTCVMVWEAHNPHDAEKETFFGYFKNDGFVKKKKLGRIDSNNTWHNIKQEWLSLYRNKDIRIGYSVRKCVTHTDEWCAEAYMETDYSQLTQEDFIRTVKNYVAYQFLNDD